MQSDCKNLERSSRYVRRWIIRQPAVKEESITDWLLFDVSQKIKRITYHAFSRHEEARITGADWEWWFLFPNFSFKLRVQAKKIKPNQDNYASIAQTNRYGLQIEKLLNDSEKQNYLPTYAFYTTKRSTVMCRKNKNNEGVFIAGARTIYNDFITPGKNNIEATDILARTNPLSCFICCPYCERDEDGFLLYLREYYRSDIFFESEHNEKSVGDERPRPLGYHSEIPLYIASFLELAKEGPPDWLDVEFHHYLEGINALVVYDVRDEYNQQ